MQLQTLKHPRKGESVYDSALGVVSVLVLLFVALFLIQQVTTITAIDNTSSLYTTFTSLITSTGTIYTVLVLVIIIVMMGLALRAMGGFGSKSGGAQV